VGKHGGLGETGGKNDENRPNEERDRAE